MKKKYFVINVNEKTLQELEYYKSPVFELINDETTIYNINEPNDSESLTFAQIAIVYTDARFATVMNELAKLEAEYHVQFMTYDEG